MLLLKPDLAATESSVLMESCIATKIVGGQRGSSPSRSCFQVSCPSS